MCCMLCVCCCSEFGVLCMLCSVCYVVRVVCCVLFIVVSGMVCCVNGMCCVLCVVVCCSFVRVCRMLYVGVCCLLCCVAHVTQWYTPVSYRQYPHPPIIHHHPRAYLLLSHVFTVAERCFPKHANVLCLLYGCMHAVHWLFVGELDVLFVVSMLRCVVGYADCDMTWC